MKVHEYQAKALLAQFGIPVPKGGLATTPAEANGRARELGGRAVLKAQVYAGGRGKAGGIKVAGSPEEAERLAGGMLGTRLVTHQTGPEGVPLNKLLVEEAIGIKKELYLSILVDSSRRMPLMMGSEAGGMDIEEVASKSPEKIIKSYIDPVIGFQPFMGRRLAYGMNLPVDLIRPAGQLMANLYKLFVAKDCSLAEINPLVITADNRLLALDAKLNFDDSGLFRHPELKEMRDTEQEAPLEVEASNQGVNYIKLDGDVGCMVNGAGLAMATMDMVKLYGAEPANFLDVGGGANEQQVAAALKIILSDPKVKRVLINIFGGILRCDVAARGIVAAARETEVKVPIVVRMSGTNLEEGKKVLADSGMNIIQARDLKEAAEKLAAVA